MSLIVWLADAGIFVYAMPLGEPEVGKPGERAVLLRPCCIYASDVRE